MNSNKLAISHPGKIGDALYALHVARALCEQHDTTCDFFTSEYCLPLKRLFEYQPFIDQIAVPETYKIDNMGCGIQPWRMPIPNDYKCVYHLGFRTTPDKPLHEFIAASIGLAREVRIEYRYPKLDIPQEDYIVLAARGETTYKDLFLEVIEKSPFRIIQIGGNGEAIGGDIGVTGLDMLETLSWISHARAFIGLMSSQLVLANGFPIPKVSPHDGKSWDMRHVVRGKYNHYPVNPSAEEVIALALSDPSELVLPTHSKSLNPADYTQMTEHEHVRNVLNRLRSVGVPHRFEHPHRAWEYGIILNALRSADVRSIIDVGGGGSVFAPAAAMMLDVNTLQVDPGNALQWIINQSMVLDLRGERLAYIQGRFEDFQGDADAVTCISTLEHIPEDILFFQKLLSHANKIVAITVDFSPHGPRPIVGGHIRTYCAEMMEELIKMAARDGFEPLDGTDYTHYGEYVNGYSFASLVLRKVDQ